MLIVSTKSSQKEDTVSKIEASILSRSNRKYWYVKSKTLFEDHTVKIEEISTKVLKTEKTLKYMKNMYLPAWVAKKIEESKVQVLNSNKFSNYAEYYIDECKDLNDVKNIEYKLVRILKDFSSREIRQITKLEVKKWILSLIDERSRQPLKKRTKSKYLGVFRGIFEQAVDDNIIDRNFIDDIKIPNEKIDLDTIKPFESEEVKVLLEQSTGIEHDKLLNPYLGIAFHQGLSPSELLGLQIGDVDIHLKVISIKRNVTKGRIKETKNIYRERTIPMFDVTIPYVKLLLMEAKEKHSIWLFSQRGGENLHDIQNIRGTRAITKNGVSIKKETGWYKLLSDCNIEYRDLKNCRHTFAVSAVESNKFKLQEIAEILGHSSLEMLIKHYARWIGKKSLKIDRNIDLFGDTSGDTSKNIGL